MRCLLAAAVALILAAPLRAGDDATKAELKKLQGTWTILSFQAANARVNAFAFAGPFHRWQITGDKITYRDLVDQEKPKEFRFKIDPGKDPKTIDLMPDKMTVAGIYRLDKDTLTIAIGDGKTREKGFDMANGRVVLQLTREKGATPEAVAQERKKFEGTWEVTECRAGDAGLAKAFKAGGRVVFTGDKLTRLLKDKKLDEGTYTIDPARPLKTIDYTPADGAAKGKTLPGMYLFAGKTLTLTFGAPGKGRPLALEMNPTGEEVILMVRRAKQ